MKYEINAGCGGIKGEIQVLFYIANKLKGT